MNDKLSRMLAPWEALPYFAMPVESNVMSGAAPQVLVQSNPMRVALLVDCQNGGNAQISTAAQTALTVGFTIGFPRDIFELTFAKHGNLVAQEWFVNSAGAVAVTVIEITMIKWN